MSSQTVAQAVTLVRLRKLHVLSVPRSPRILKASTREPPMRTSNRHTIVVLLAAALIACDGAMTTPTPDPPD